ncbi:hypothetical protein TNCV_2383551 [Trichonephila clavipes]|nr:hypothetical protein TNCV_2383551 [Trichonephila clavipes]
MELIKRSGESSHQEIRKLLIGEELGDRPAFAHSCTIHSAAISPTLEKAAEVAGSSHEVTPIALTPGVAASFQLIASRYVWPNMRKTVKDWVQKLWPLLVNVRRAQQTHEDTSLGTSALPDAKIFTHSCGFDMSLYHHQKENLA